MISKKKFSFERKKVIIQLFLASKSSRSIPKIFWKIPGKFSTRQRANTIASHSVSEEAYRSIGQEKLEGIRDTAVLDYNHPLTKRPCPGCLRKGLRCKQRLQRRGRSRQNTTMDARQVGRWDEQLFLSPCKGGAEEEGGRTLQYSSYATPLPAARRGGSRFELETNLETARSGYGRE